MIALVRTFIAVTGVAFAAHAAAQVSFCEKESFLRGQCFSTQRPIGDFSRYGFNALASSAEVTTGRWEVCEASRFDGHCLVLRQGRYPFLVALGLNDPVTTLAERYVERSAKVSSACLVAVARNRYSVPCELAGQRVRTRLYPNRVEIASNETIVASHARLINRGNISYDWQHYIALAQRKPGALTSGAPIADIPGPLLHWGEGLMRHDGGDKTFAQGLNCVLPRCAIR